jgi:hypothetical protein
VAEGGWEEVEGFVEVYLSVGLELDVVCKVDRNAASLWDVVCKVDINATSLWDVVYKVG